MSQGLFFLLGPYVAVCLARWWQSRMDHVGGMWGAHHFYLRRNTQGVLWLLTGGGFGQGWLRDAVRIPAYVAEANATEEWVRTYKALVKAYERPPTYFSHLYFKCAAGLYAFFVVRMYTLGVFSLAGVHQAFGAEATPDARVVLSLSDEGGPWGTISRASAGAALGAAVWGVGSTGRQRCSFGWTVGAAALAAAVGGAGGGAGFFIALLAALVQSFRTRRWHLAEDGAQALSGWGVVRVLLLLGAAWLVLIVLALRKFDLYVHDETNGEYSTWRMFQDIFSQVRNNGFDKERWGEWTSDRARGTSGMSAREARSVLGVGVDATTSAIRKAHRDLSREWHPDKWHGDVDKLTEAEEMQVRLNLAKDVLMERAPTPDMPDD